MCIVVAIVVRPKLPIDVLRPGLIRGARCIRKLVENYFNTIPRAPLQGYEKL